MCHICPLICSIWRKHFPVFSYFMTYHLLCNSSVTGGAGTVYLSEHLSSSPVCNGVHVARSLVFCVVFCRSLLVLLSFLFWPLRCLFFFDLRILITPFVSAILRTLDNSSTGVIIMDCSNLLYIHETFEIFTGLRYTIKLKLPLILYTNMLSHWIFLCLFIDILTKSVVYL